MENLSTPSSETSPPSAVRERNRLEIIRFASREDCRKAIGVLLEHGMLNFASSAPNQWAVRTDVVRALRSRGVPFEWLTEHT